MYVNMQTMEIRFNMRSISSYSANIGLGIGGLVSGFARQRTKIDPR
jgi:hypothetical protein